VTTANPTVLRAEEHKPAPAPPNRTLFFLALGLMAAAGFSLLQAWLHRWNGTAFTYCAEEVCLAGALWLNRRGAVQWATVLLCLSELACSLFLIAYYGVGFSDEELLLFPLILVTAAVLMEWRAYVTFAAVVCVSVGVTGYMLARYAAVGTTNNRVVNVLNILAVTAAAVGLLARNLKRSVFEAREAEQHVKALSGRLLHAQEEERARLARELHDDLSQQIAALSLRIGNLKRQIPTEYDDARTQSELIHQKLVQVSETVRRMSHELHPAILQYAGLEAALESFCQEFGSLSGVDVSLAIHGDFNGVPSSVALCVYRIVQESLRNIARHAKVAAAKVDIGRAGGILTLTVSDAGVGLDLASVEAKAGLGLVSMRERVRLAGGSLEIASRPRHGTTVLARIPD
jgi:signal transduction histidine kinase